MITKKTSKGIMSLLLLIAGVVACYLMYQKNDTNLIDYVMIVMVLIVGLVSIHIHLLTSLITTFFLTLAYGVFVIIAGTTDSIDPVDVNYYYLLLPLSISLLTGFVGLFDQKNIRLSSEFEENYKALVRIDTLTGFRNENDYKENLTEEINRMKRYDTSLSVMILHIESFDELNRLYGESQGEKFLKYLSEFVIDLTRNVDKHYRIANGVFALILPNTDDEGALILKERFIEELESLSIVVKSNNQEVDIAVDIVYESYTDGLLETDAFHNLVMSKLIVRP